MNLLALDLGTKTGIACNVGTELNITTAVWATPREVAYQHRLRMDRRCDFRVVKFFKALRQSVMHSMAEAVVFEDVQFSSYTLQTQLWSSLRAAVWLAFPDKLIECVPTGTLKKFATGHGGATKEMMAAHLKSKQPKIWRPDLDDNAVDAAWLWVWGQKNLARSPKLV